MKDWLKHHFKEVLALKTTPHEIALGFSVGTTIAILPTPGISILIGLLIILLYERISKISLFAAMAIFNPFVMAPVYVASYSLGNLLLGNAPVEIIGFTGIWEYTRRFLLGNVIIAGIIGMLSYYTIYFITKFVKKE